MLGSQAEFENQDCRGLAYIMKQAPPGQYSISLTNIRTVGHEGQQGKRRINACNSCFLVEITGRPGLIYDSPLQIAKTRSMQYHPYAPIVHGQLDTRVGRSDLLCL